MAASAARSSPAPHGRAAALLLCGALLAGCALRPPPPPLAGERFAGRLAIKVDGHPERSSSAGFELSGSADAGWLLLTTPLGTTAAKAVWQQGQAELESAGTTQRFDSLDALVQAAVGEDLPLAALFDWLRGRPWPGAASAARDDGVAGFNQLSWQVDLSRQREGVVDALRRAPSPALNVRVRLDAAQGD